MSETGREIIAMLAKMDERLRVLEGRSVVDPHRLADALVSRAQCSGLTVTLGTGENPFVSVKSRW